MRSAGTAVEVGVLLCIRRRRGLFERRRLLTRRGSERRQRPGLAVRALWPLASGNVGSSRFGAGVGAVVGVPEALGGKVRIDLGRGEGLVPEELLDGAEVGAV